MVHLTATEVARSFSDVLTRVAAGEEIEVTRGGTPVAVICPPRATFISAERFRQMLATAPGIDDGYAADVRDAADTVPAPDDPWRS